MKNRAVSLPYLQEQLSKVFRHTVCQRFFNREQRGCDDTRLTGARPDVTIFSLDKELGALRFAPSSTTNAEPVHQLTVEPTGNKRNNYGSK
jgi:hypothetical protein